MLPPRTGSLVWRGAVSSASVLNSGTGTVYVSGVRDSVNVNLSGLGNVVVDAASGVRRCMRLHVPVFAWLPWQRPALEVSPQDREHMVVLRQFAAQPYAYVAV
jgi:hypothetical protein